MIFKTNVFSDRRFEQPGEDSLHLRGRPGPSQPTGDRVHRKVVSLREDRLGKND